MKKTFQTKTAIILLLISFLWGCSQAANTTLTHTPTVEHTSTATQIPSPTATATPTVTPTPLPMNGQQTQYFI